MRCSEEALTRREAKAAVLQHLLALDADIVANRPGPPGPVKPP
jgi:hypothetical protein